MKVSEIIKKAVELLKDTQHCRWMRGTWGYQPTVSGSGRPYCCCAGGALNWAYTGHTDKYGPEPELQAAYEACEAVIDKDNEEGHTNLTAWNDRPETTLSAVIAVMQSALANVLKNEAQDNGELPDEPCCHFGP